MPVAIPQQHILIFRKIWTESLQYFGCIFTDPVTPPVVKQYDQSLPLPQVTLKH